MKTALTGLAIAGLLVGTMPVQAAEDTPGKKMQSGEGPGASEYAPKSDDNPSEGTSPGHQMQEETGPGASQYAPGQDGDITPGASGEAPGHNK
jgi:hypothetical protein